MRSLGYIALVVGLPLLLGAGKAGAANYAFLHIADLKGEVQEKSHAGWIGVLSYHWEAQRPNIGMVSGTLSGDRSVLEALTITKNVDATSPVLALAVCDGRHFKGATLELVRGADLPVTFLKITLENVVVGSYVFSGSVEHPTETITLSFGKIAWEYTIQDPAGRPVGTVQKGWDLQAAEKM
jgi:type VI secretion system secreted protein Hcp